MKTLIKVADFYVFSNLHVAFATFCLTKTTLIQLDNQSNKFAFFVFFATLLSYNFIRLYRKQEVKSWLYKWISLNKNYLYIIVVVSLIALIWFGWQLKPLTLLALVPAGVLTFFYVISITGRSSLRALPRLKLFLIAFCWAYITVLLPLIDVGLEFTQDVWVTFLQRFFFVAAITLPFDIRDMDFDHASLKTIPQMVGEAKAKRIGILFLMLFVGLNFFKENPLELLRTEFAIVLISLFLLVRATKSQHKYYSAFFVEAIPMIWYLMLQL